MASFKQYTASGGATEAFSIPTFTSDEIKVRVDGVLKTATTHYTIESYTVNGGTLTWTSGNIPSSGTVRIYRDTKILNNASSDVEGKATYYAGSSIKAGDLNNNQKQALRALEEEDELIQTYDIEDAAITTPKLADSSVTGAKIVNDTIASGKLMVNSVTLTKIADASVSTAKLAENAVTAFNIAPDSVDSSELVDGGIDLQHLSANSVDSSKIVDNTIVNADINTSANIVGTKLADDSIAKEKLSDAILKSLATNLTSSATELNQLDGKTITTSLTANNTTIPTGSAVNSWIINLLTALGGFYVISNEVSFPNTNPDPEDNAGTAVSIGDAGGVVVNGSGVSTTGRTVGGSTVTITGFPSAFQSKTLSAGMGLIVQTTSTLNTYTYHKAIGTDSDIITISDQVSSFNQRYRFGSSDPTSDNDQGDLFFNTTSNLFKVFDDGNWIKTVPSDADLSNIAIVAGELGWSDDLGSITESLTAADGGDINTVADNIAAIQRYANEYKIAGSAPGSPSAGDLWYDTGNNVIKVYTGSAWVQVFNATDILDEDNFASNSATKVASQQSIKAYVDGQTENDTTYAISCVDGDNSDEEKIRLTAGGTGSGTDDVVLEAGTGLTVARSGDKITFTNTITDTTLTDEAVQDVVGAMLSSNTETGITVTYQDADGTIDFAVASQTDENFTTADHAKLDGIEASATADQTASEIKTLLESDNLTAAHLAANCVDSSELVDGSVDHSHLANDCVDGDNIADDSINSEHYVDASIDTAHIANLQVTTAKIAADAITGAKIADDAVDSEHLVADSIDAEHYAAGSVDTTALGADAVTGAKIADDAVGAEHIEVLDAALQFGDSVKAQFGTGNDLYIQHDGTNSEIAVANAHNFWIKNYADGANEAMAAFRVNGACELYYDAVKRIETTSAGATVTGTLTADLADNSIDSEHYTDGSIDTAHLAADVVTGAKIADDALDSEHYTDGSIDTAHLSADCVTAAKIGDDVINSEHIAAGAVDLEHMSSESVDEDNLKISNSGSNGEFLQKQSGNTGGLTWAAVTQADTTYAISCVDGDNSDEEKIRLTAGGSGSGTDDVVLEAGTGLSIARSGDKITFTNTVADTTLNLIDEDDMSSDSATRPPSQQSVKAYVDNNSGGNAATFTATANNSANETVYLIFADGATGAQGAETDTGLNYNPSTGVLTTTQVTGNLTGTVTGTATGLAGSPDISVGTISGTNLTLDFGTL